mgnify:FL=1
MMDIFKKDDFFKNPHQIRNIALGLDWKTWKIAETPSFGGGWRGARSADLSTYNNPILDKAIKEVYSFAWDLMDLSNYKYPAWDNYDNLKEDGTCEFIHNRKIVKPKISTYFHLWRKKSDLGYHDWYSRYHQDFLPAAGVVYLHENPPENTGTSIIDSLNNQFIHVDNKWNRFVVYNGYYPHGISQSFGVGKEDSRLTLNFFIFCSAKGKN